MSSSPARAIIALAQRRQRPGSGSNLAAISKLVPLLADWPAIFRRTRYAVSARAAQLYLPARHTLGIGMLIRAEDASMAADELRAAAARLMGPLAIPGGTWRLENGEEQLERGDPASG